MISEIQVPSIYSSVHNSMLFVVDSTNRSQPNFKYVFDVYMGGVKQATFKIFPDPDTDYGVFNVARTLRSFVNHKYFKDNIQLIRGINPNGGLRMDYQIKYGEEYGTPVVTYTNLFISATHTAWNYYNDPVKAGDFAQLSSYQFYPLTNRPLSQKVTLNDVGYFSFWNPGAPTPQPVEIKAYDETGALIYSDTTLNTGTSELVQIGYTPLCLAADFIDVSAAAYYTIKVGTKTFTFTIDCFSRYKNYSLVFLNRLGGYESAYFRMKNSRSMEIERKTFGSNPFKMDKPGGASRIESFTSRVFLGTQGTYHTKQKIKYKLSTEFLTDDEFVWLGELVASPIVYMQLEYLNNFNYYPVSITATNYDFKTRGVHGINPLELEVELLTNTNSQFL